MTATAIKKNASTGQEQAFNFKTQETDLFSHFSPGGSDRQAIQDMRGREVSLRCNTSSHAITAKILDHIGVDPGEATLSLKGLRFVEGFVPGLSEIQDLADARAMFRSGDVEKIEEARIKAVMAGMDGCVDATLVGGPFIKALHKLSGIASAVPGAKNVDPLRQLARLTLTNDQFRDRIDDVLGAQPAQD